SGATTAYTRGTAERAGSLPRRAARRISAWWLSRLLNRREDPLPAGGADERPDLGRGDVLEQAAVDDPPGRIARDVDHREAHRHGGVFAAALAPGLRQVALQQLHVGDLVARALARLVGKLLAEVAQHLGR